jgi:uncharacterized protein (DUF433 family)
LTGQCCNVTIAAAKNECPEEAAMPNYNGYNRLETPAVELVQERYGGELYEYYPLGQYIVAAPGVCGGRPTFKYTRLEATMILARLSRGETVEELLQAYAASKLNAEAIYEAIHLASQALLQVTQPLRHTKAHLEVVGA